MTRTLDDVDFLFLPLRGDYLRACGAEAEEWIRSVQDHEIYRLARGIDRSMRLLREKEVETARRQLRDIEMDILAVSTRFSSVRSLLRRYLFAARAYLHYLDGDLETARKDLLRAREELTEVLTRHSFLWPLAVHLIDLYSQEARIARREYRWQDAKARVEAIRGIYTRNEPFCTLGSGQAVRMSDLRGFFDDLPLDDEQREQAAVILGDDGSVEERTRQLEEQVFALPDFVIPYP